jgi:molecular chaperone DnaJ
VCEQDETVEQDIDSAFVELGLTPDATEREVKAAWRRLVSQWHPDRNSSAAALVKMQRLNRAVEAIRQAGFRQPGPSANADGAKPGQSEEPQRDGEPHFDDAAEADSGRPDDHATADRNASGPPSRTIQRRVRLTLEEAAFGCTRVLRGKVTEDCSACEGAGHRVLGACLSARASRPGSALFGWTHKAECDSRSGTGGLRCRGQEGRPSDTRSRCAFRTVCAMAICSAWMDATESRARRQVT